MRELVRADEHDRSRSLGWLAVWWIESFFVHGPRDVQSRPGVNEDEINPFIVEV